MQSAAEKDHNHIGPLFGVLVGMMMIEENEILPLPEASHVSFTGVLKRCER